MGPAERRVQRGREVGVAFWLGGRQKQSDQPSGVPLDWAQMRTLAQECQQIIDGRFTGYDESGQAQLQMQAIDSSYWVVWSRDAAVLGRVRTAFTDVEDYEEPTPEPLVPPNG